MKKSLAIGILILADCLSILVALYLSSLFFVAEQFNYFEPSIIYLSIGFLLLFQKIYFIHLDYWEELKRVYKALILSVLIYFTWSSVVASDGLQNPSQILLFFVLALLLFPLQKRSIKFLLTKYKMWHKKIALDVNPDMRQVFKEEFEKNWYLGLEYSRSANTVIMSARGEDKTELLQKANRYLLKQKEVFFVPVLDHINFADSQVLEMHNLRLSLIGVQNRLQNPYLMYMKIAVDILFLLFAFPVFLLVFLFFALLIFLESKGPIIFRQKRLGLNGRPFQCYKFRTMHIHQDELLHAHLQEHPEEIRYYEKYHKYKNDPRVTKVGKWLRKSSLDELPQIINILKGEMSLIGPRPYMITERHKLKPDQKEILMLKPGITGLWQISGRSDLDFESRKELDRWYIRNWSLWLDIVILMKTTKVVLLGKGAS